MAFLSCQGLWCPLKVPLEGPSCWRTRIQVINSRELQGLGFGVKKKLSRAFQKCPILAKIQVLKPFQPSRPLFLTKNPSKWPHIMLAHVLGPHWYLLEGPRSKNIQFIAILLNPICQSGPKMGQNSQNYNFKCKSAIFWFQWTKNYQKTIILGFQWLRSVILPFSGLFFVVLAIILAYSQDENCLQ